jgi:hypothetical protein
MSEVAFLLVALDFALSFLDTMVQLNDLSTLFEFSMAVREGIRNYWGIMGVHGITAQFFFLKETVSSWQIAKV